MRKGYMYLTAIIDLHSRYVLNWSVSNSMDFNGVRKHLRKLSDFMVNQLSLIPIKEVSTLLKSLPTMLNQKESNFLWMVKEEQLTMLLMKVYGEM